MSFGNMITFNQLNNLNSLMALGYTAKSVIVDIADNWGNPSYLGIRQIDFYNDDEKLPLVQDDFTADGTSTSENTHPKYCFDTTSSLTGLPDFGGYLVSIGNTQNQRILVVFNEEQTFNRIIVNNIHILGFIADGGARNVKIHISSDSIEDVTYDAVIPNSRLIFDGEFPMHSDVDEASPHEIELI